MATISERIQKIEEALASGISSTTIDGQTVTRSLSEMRRELTRLRGLEASAGGGGVGIPGIKMYGLISSNGRGE